MRVAIVGATGAVGRTMLSILEERSFPLDELVLLASERTAGTRLKFRGEERTVKELTPSSLDGIDLALSRCGSAIAETWVPEAAEGAVGAGAATTGAASGVNPIDSIPPMLISAVRSGGRRCRCPGPSW